MSENYIVYNGAMYAFNPNMEVPIRQVIALDTQEQGKAKGAKICPHCGVYCATETEGE